MRQSRQQAEREAARDEGQQAAARLEAHLQAGGLLTPIQAPGLPLDDGEMAYADVSCWIAHLYATETVYPRAQAGYYEYHPTFGQRWIRNPKLEARRRQQAEDDARERWRDHTAARVVLTSIGLRVNKTTAPDAWLPFDHGLLTDTAVDAARGEVVLSYSVCAPLLLAGAAAPWLGVAVDYLVSAGS